MAASQRKVCKICFNSSSHKPKPYLSPESKARIDPKTKKSACSQCHQEWIPISVCKEPSTERWVHVRSGLQKNVKMCKFIKPGGTNLLCPKGQRCIFAHNLAEMAKYSQAQVSRSASCSDSAKRQHLNTSVVQTDMTRTPPILSFHIKEFKLCKYIKPGSCVLGELCTYAHSDRELQEWNDKRIPQDPQQKSDHSDEAECTDFASRIRSTLVSKYRQNATAEELGMTEAHNSVTIKETSGSKLAQIGNKQNSYNWTFEVSAKNHETLNAVVLFDTFSQEFQISKITGCKGQGIPLICENKLEAKINQSVHSDNKVYVEVTLKNIAQPGILNQLVIFEFQSMFRTFMMARGLCVYILSDLEKVILPKQEITPFEKVDLHWEHHYKEVPMETNRFSEDVDSILEEYLVPENLKLDDPVFDKTLSKENYREKMHYLLYVEEYECKKKMSRYDIYNVKIEADTSYEEQLKSGTVYAPTGHFFVNVSLEEAPFEGINSIRSGDSALILLKSRNEVHHCIVEHVGKEYAILFISEKTKDACYEVDNLCSVRFVPGRLPVRAMHHAIDHIDLDKIFPTPSSLPKASSISNQQFVKRCFIELEEMRLNPFQNEVVSSIIMPELTNVPTLVLGPFGVGKTRTLCESIKLIARNIPDAHILVCTHSNSAANLYVTDLHSHWERTSQKHSMFRLYFTKRRITTIRPSVLEYCKIENNRLSIPSLKEIQNYKVIVTTLTTSRILPLLGLKPGHFSHIIVDEAAQTLEPETIIPLSLADKRTKIVLAGDHLQLSPRLYSLIAKKHDFHITLLERLYNQDIYKSSDETLSQCRALLTMNYRSCQEILELPSRLFYKTEFVSCAHFPPKEPDAHAVRFVGVYGQECQDKDSPSYYNDREAEEVCKQVKYLKQPKFGLRDEEICALAYDQMQVAQLRRFLRKEALSSVKVYRVEDVQGEEFRALIVSTVRTCTKKPPLQQGTGFLTDPKLLNTAITRAREWLIVVGEPITLCTVGSNRMCWMEFIKYCSQNGSFNYPVADAMAQNFESCLENRYVLRGLLEESQEALIRDTSYKMQFLDQNVISAQKNSSERNNHVNDVNATSDNHNLPQPMLINGNSSFPKLPPSNKKMDTDTSFNVTKSQECKVSTPNCPQETKKRSPASTSKSTVKHSYSTVASKGRTSKSFGVSEAQTENKHHVQHELHSQKSQEQPMQSSSVPSKSTRRPPSTIHPGQAQATFEHEKPTKSMTSQPNDHIKNTRTNVLSPQAQPFIPGVAAAVETTTQLQLPLTQTKSPDRNEETMKIDDDVTIHKNKLIGQGAFGHVFKGTFKSKFCAIKVLSSIGTEFLTDLPTGSSIQNVALEKFRHECNRLQQIEHKNVVRHLATRTIVKGHIQTPVLVMELLDCSLTHYIRDYTLRTKQKNMKRFIQVSLSVDVASALEFLHDDARKLVHRDLCGDNILLATDGPFPIAKVSDFGMSRIINLETMSRSLSALGHRNGYLPREAASESYDSSLDIFMFGAVMTQIANHIYHIESEKQRIALVASISSDHPLLDTINDCLKDKHVRPKAGNIRKKLCEKLQDCMK